MPAMNFQYLWLRLTEHLPLKQGLRLSIGVKGEKLAVTLTEHLPLKQGLRLLHYREHPLKDILLLTEHLPLKQGLRLYYLLYLMPTWIYPHRASSTKTRIKTMQVLWLLLSGGCLTEHLPLKQGLRLITSSFLNSYRGTSQSIFH